MPSPCLATSLALLATAAAAAHAQTRVVYVDQTAPAGGDGTSWSHAFRDLRAALATVNAAGIDAIGIELRIAQGTYRSPVSGRRDIPAFSLAPQSTTSGAAISIQGGFAGLGGANPDARDFVRTPTVLSADALANDTSSASTRSDNSVGVLAIVGNRLSVRVGGLEFAGATPVAGSSSLGGGLCTEYGAARTAVIEDCLFRDNQAQYGGAMHLEVSDWVSTSELRRCRFLRNKAQVGGAVSISGSITVSDCLFEGNSATDAGGASASSQWSNSFVATRCIFRGNHAGNRGGAVFGGGLFDTCLFVGNDAGGVGGAAAMLYSMRLRLCTLAHNRAGWGGGVYAEGGSSYNGRQIESCILWLNRATLGGDQLAGSFPFPSILGTATEGGLDGMFLVFGTPEYVVGRDILTTDPHFIDSDGPDNDPTTLADNDYHLSPRSPARDQGQDTSLSLLDLDLHPRSVAGIQGLPPLPDLGCYESQLTLCPADITADQAVTVDDLLAFVEAYAAGGWLADLTTDGASPQPDGAVTIDDLLYFLARFEDGC